MFDGPVKTLWFGKFKYHPGERVGRHFHDFHQLIFVTGGKGILLFPEEQYTFRKNILYLIPPFFEHDFISDTEDPLLTNELKFKVELPDLTQKLDPLAGDIDIPDGREIFQDIVIEVLKNGPYLHDLLNAQVLVLLFKLLDRSHTALGHQERVHSNPVKSFSYKGIDLRNLFEFIDEHLHRAITLEDLSTQVGFSSKYLCRVFKSKYGVTPIKFINDLRIERAKEQLRQTDHSITEIAERTGFQSIHYFSRVFKEKENISPGEYKKKYSHNLTIQLERSVKSIDGMKPAI